MDRRPPLPLRVPQQKPRSQTKLERKPFLPFCLPAINYLRLAEIQSCPPCTWLTGYGGSAVPFHCHHYDFAILGALAQVHNDCSL